MKQLHVANLEMRNNINGGGKASISRLPVVTVTEGLDRRSNQNSKLCVNVYLPVTEV